MSAKRRINLNEEKLEKAIAEAIAEIVDEAIPFDSSTELNPPEMLIEMSQINVDERQIFPYDGYVIKVWSNDHNPPHFHIISDDWDVEFLIENGDVYKIKKKGNKEQTFSYMKHNVGEWLKMESVINKGKTNQENAWIAWKQNNPR